MACAARGRLEEGTVSQVRTRYGLNFLAWMCVGGCARGRMRMRMRMRERKRVLVRECRRSIHFTHSFIHSIGRSRYAVGARS